jgi:hypothetical protein
LAVFVDALDLAVQAGLLDLEGGLPAQVL